MGDIFDFLLAGGVDGAEFVATGGNSYGSAKQDVILPPEVYAGQLMVVVSYYQKPTSGSGGLWEYAGSVGSESVNPSFKVLAPADLAAPVRIPAGGIWAVYRGVSRLLKRTGGGASGGGPLLPGFAKSPDCGGLLYVGTGSGNTSGPGMGSPAVLRAEWLLVPGGMATERRSIADIIPPSAYVNGAAIPTGGSSNGTTSASIYELLP